MPQKSSDRMVALYMDLAKGERMQYESCRAERSLKENCQAVL